MPLIKENFKAELKSLFEELRGYDGTEGKTQDDAVEKFADLLSSYIDSYIKSATITVAAGIPVSTAGTAAAQTGVTTAPGTATIS